MRVLIVNISDINGGAARAAYRLHKALLAQHIDSQMLVQKKHTDDPTVIIQTGILKMLFNKLRPTLDSLPVRFCYKQTKVHFSPSAVPFDYFIKQINEMNPDIVHLHWICSGLIRIEALTKIDAPIIWSLHDNWAFTGGCHVKWECDKFKKKCGACPRLGSNKENDLSRKVWNRKAKSYSKLPNIVINGISSWISNCSRESSLFKDKEIVNIPNLIDTDVFKPSDKSKARAFWNLPINGKFVLFGANDNTNDPNKGYVELCEALHKLKNNDIELAVFGSSEPSISQEFGFTTHYLGHIHDDISLVTLYNAVDIVLVPSLQENLSNIIMESMACATPVVAFNVGGNSDMIVHKINGYLANAFDTTDLAYGIDLILNSSYYDDFCQKSRQKILENFDSKLVALKYIELYEKVINDRISARFFE